MDTIDLGSRMLPHVFSEQERRDNERRELLVTAALYFVGTALFPRLSYRLRWASRLSVRGMLIYVLVRTVEIFAVRTWGPPLLMRWSQRAADEKKKAAAELGHEPTPDEFGAYLRRQDPGLR